MHEIALHHNQSPADFQPPFPQETFASGVTAKEAVGPAHIGALGECLTATHGILDTILSVPLDILLTLPVIFCESFLSFYEAGLILLQVYGQSTPSCV